MQSNYVVVNTNVVQLQDEVAVEGERITFSRECRTIEATPLAEEDKSGTIRLVLVGEARAEFDNLIPGNVLVVTIERAK